MQHNWKWKLIGGCSKFTFFVRFFPGFPRKFSLQFSPKKARENRHFLSNQYGPHNSKFSRQKTVTKTHVFPKKFPAKIHEHTPINFYQFSFLFFHIILHQENWFISHDDNCFLLCQLWSRFDDKFARFGWRDGAGSMSGFFGVLEKENLAFSWLFLGPWKPWKEPTKNKEETPINNPKNSLQSTPLFNTTERLIKLTIKNRERSSINLFSLWLFRLLDLLVFPIFFYFTGFLFSIATSWFLSSAGIFRFDQEVFG